MNKPQLQREINDLTNRIMYYNDKIKDLNINDHPEQFKRYTYWISRDTGSRNELENKLKTII